jgi:hypothetical protein
VSARRQVHHGLREGAGPGGEMTTSTVGRQRPHHPSYNVDQDMGGQWWACLNHNKDEAEQATDKEGEPTRESVGGIYEGAKGN